MQILPVAAAIAAAVLPLAPAQTSIVRSDPVLVRLVIDGDTIDVAAIGRVRLLGIDAPEIGRGFDTAAPFAREARDRLTALVLHRWIRLEYEGERRDVYDRRLAYVLTEDGVFVNAALVRDGLARVTAREPLVRLGELKRAEVEAQQFRRGMWGETPSLSAVEGSRAGYTRRSASPKTRAPHPKSSSRSRSKSKTKKPKKPRA